MSLDEYHMVLQDASSHQIVSFEDLPSRDTTVVDGFSAKIIGPLESLQEENIKEVLGKMIASLPEREKLVMSLYYDEELNLRETGEVLGVSESRVCQIHSQALIRLKSKIQRLFSENDDE
jgi:RNA polymerase sigma factor for flagellar operon FliA